MIKLPSVDQMFEAFATKNPAFDGTFFVAVRTTGVFCRPVCRAKPPRRENIEFFATPTEATRNGYRPCKLCKPTQNRVAPPALVTQLIELIDRDPSRRLTGHDLREMKIDPSTARRHFQSYCRTSFAAYQRARRMSAGLETARQGERGVNAQINAGFDSSSGFRDAFAKLFGTRVSNANDVSVLTSRWLATPLGQMLAVTSDDGIVLLDFFDRKGLPRAIERLRQRSGSRATPAVIVPGNHAHLTKLEQQLGEYFAGTRRSFSVSIAPLGTAFELNAWSFLSSIPFAQTRSYAQQADVLGAPRAMRAVGRANGMNYISIVIPCHRVIGANGDLTGYGGGLARKRWLLEHERRVANLGTRHDGLSPTAPARTARAAGTI